MYRIFGCKKNLTKLYKSNNQLSTNFIPPYEDERAGKSSTFAKNEVFGYHTEHCINWSSGLGYCCVVAEKPFYRDFLLR